MMTIMVQKWWSYSILILMMTVAVFLNGCSSTSEPVSHTTSPLTESPQLPTESPSDIEATEPVYSFEPEWWLEAQTYGMFNYWGDTDFNRLETTSCTVNGYRLVYDFNLVNSQFNFQEDINAAHECSLKYVIGINFNSIISKWPDEVEGLASKGACAVTYEGGEAIESGGETVYYFSTNHPLWQETLIKQAKRIVDLNADGIAVIAPWGSSFYACYGGRPDFSDASLEGFRNYLERKYSSQELVAMGIDDLIAFNYLNYLHSQDIGKDELDSAPLYEDYREFHRESAVEFYQQFVSEVKEYARLKGINNFPIAPANHGGWLLPLMINLLPYSDFTFTNLDLGDFINYYDYHTFEYKLLNSALEARPVATFMDASLGWLVQNSNSPEDMMQIKIAEAYANKGAFQDQYQAGLTEEGPIGYSIDAQAVNKMNSFYLENKDLFNISSRSLAKVAVLLSAKSVTDTESSHWSMFIKVCRILTASHYQYDVILSQDSNFTANTLTLEKLQQYEVIILPENDRLDSRTISLIPEYLVEGGNLIIVNEVDAELILPQGTTCQVINWEPDLSRSGWDNNREFLDVIDNMLEKRVCEDTLPREVGIQVWQDGNKILVHLTNHDFNLNEGVIEKKNIQVSINLPLEMKSVSVRILSPDFEEAQILDFTFTDSKLHLVVADLKIWDILVIE
jgi:hypothetical protein